MYKIETTSIGNDFVMELRVPKHINAGMLALLACGAFIALSNVFVGISNAAVLFFFALSAASMIACFVFYLIELLVPRKRKPSRIWRSISLHANEQILTLKGAELSKATKQITIRSADVEKILITIQRGVPFEKSFLIRKVAESKFSKVWHYSLYLVPKHASQSAGKKTLLCFHSTEEEEIKDIAARIAAFTEKPVEGPDGMPQQATPSALPHSRLRA